MNTSRNLATFSLLLLAFGFSFLSLAQEAGKASTTSTSAGPIVNLQQAINSALEKNEVVRQSGENVRQGQEQLRQAKGAILPNVALAFNHLSQPRPEDPLARQLFPSQQTTTRI